MPTYHVKTIKGRKEKFYPCDGITVTVVPSVGYFADNPEEIGVPKGQRIKLELSHPVNCPGEILIPRDGTVAHIMNEKGDTLQTYPKKRDRQQELRVLDEQGK